MTKFIELLCLLLLLHVSASSQDPSRNTLSAVHAELTSYGFPIGLLPTSIQNYTLNRTSGDFSLYFGDSCRVTLPPDNYLATYSKKITGKIVHAHIADLDGIQVRAFFKWWSITGIRSSNDNLVFEVGMVTAKYPSKNFDESLECEGRHSASRGLLFAAWLHKFVT